MPVQFTGSGEQAFPSCIQQRLVGERAGSHDPHHLALDRALASRRITDLLAEGDRLAQSDQPRQVLLDRVMGDARHRNRLSGRLAAIGQRDVEQLGGASRVVVKQLVKIAHPIEQQQVGMLRLEPEILLHHRRMGGAGLRHVGSGLAIKRDMLGQR